MATLFDRAGAAGPQIRDALAAAAERLAQSTVQVRDAAAPESARGARGASGAGSGVIWSPDGTIVTNAHVVRGGRRMTVELTDGRTFDAEVTRVDRRRDLAALAVDALHLPAARPGDSSALRVGELVLALGHPWGVRNSMTTGIVHAVGVGPWGGAGRWVQADVALAPGNSGGPLADAWGRVVGVNSMIVRGLAFAVPSEAVTRFLAAPAAGARRPAIGVTVRAVAVRADVGSERLAFVVLGVAQASAAERAGLQVGDVILGVGGEAFATPRDLADALADAGDGGAALELDVARGGRRPVTVRVTPSVPDARAAA